MNRRDFIKSVPVAATLPAIAITCKYEDDEKGSEKKSENCGSDWPYTVFCYNRGQGEWTFSQNVSGPFNEQREYMTFEDEDDWLKPEYKYYGFMYDGRLHFETIDDATSFIEEHHRKQDIDTNIEDVIYDVYFLKSYDEGEGSVEIQVAHYWFNGDTGRTVHWVSNKPYINYNFDFA